MATPAPPIDKAIADKVALLFTTPTPPPSLLAPKRLANAGPESTDALLKTLRDNHVRNHVFFNHQSFHNHAAHHVLAIYALGASGPVIESAYYDTHLDHMRDPVNMGVTITEDNFNDFLGDEDYYGHYLAYFQNIVMSKGIAACLEEYIFSPRYNIDPAREAKGLKQAEMLNRFLEIILHPIIHTGYGAEFGLPGMLAEGLAQTCIHPAGATVLVTKMLFKRGNAVTQPGLFSRISSAFYGSGEPNGTPSRAKTHAFTILNRMLKDDRFENKILDKVEYAEMLEKHGDAIIEYAQQWNIEINSQRDFEDAYEQIVWSVTMMYGIGSWFEHSEYTADFFTMHLITSALFLPSVCAYLSYPSQTLLLKGHFLSSITWWLVRGRPAFPIVNFFSKTRTHPEPIGPQPTPAPDCLPSPTSPFALTPNPWLPLIQTTITHPNEHLCKLQRTLMHFADLYGSRGKGTFVGTGLPETEELDGSLFIRVALLTADVLGWPREGQPNTGIWNWQEFEKKG